MKTLLLAGFVLISAAAFSQQKNVTQAVIYTTTNIIAPEEDDVQNIQGANQGGMNFRNMLDGEIKSTTYIKNDLMKTVLKSEMGRSTIIRDNNKKLTTTLMEIMGMKQGFYATDEEQAEEKRKRDSIQQSRRKNDSTFKAPPAPDDKQVEVVYTNETKKIAGYQCRKAYFVTTRLLGKDSMAVWFTPELKIPYLSFTGGLSGLPMGASANLTKFELIDGFIMAYETKFMRNRKMQIEVTKIDLEKEIADKEFDIPKDFELKPMKEMRHMFGGMGGPGRGQ